MPLIKSVNAALRFIVAATVLATTRVSASSQDLPQTVEAIDLTAGGKLIGCSLQFSIGLRDQVYKQGALAVVTGSINVWRKGNYISSFKLVGADIDNGGPIAFPIASAHLFSGPGPFEASPIECEDSRHYCAAIEGTAFLDVMGDAAEKGKIRMAFNRKLDGMDVPVALNVPPQVALDALECAERLSR